MRVRAFVDAAAAAIAACALAFAALVDLSTHCRPPPPRLADIDAILTRAEVALASAAAEDGEPASVQPAASR